MNTQMPVWSDDDSIGTRIARHRAPWSEQQRRMIEEERRAQIEAHDLLMLRGHDPLHGYEPQAGGALYEPSSPAPSRDRWLVIGVVIGLVAIGWAAWRRLRPESKVCLFALVIAAVAIVGKWGAA
jgi:hypothetical protein